MAARIVASLTRSPNPNRIASAIETGASESEAGGALASQPTTFGRQNPVRVMRAITKRVHKPFGAVGLASPAGAAPGTRGGGRGRRITPTSLPGHRPALCGEESRQPFQLQPQLGQLGQVVGVGLGNVDAVACRYGDEAVVSEKLERFLHGGDDGGPPSGEQLFVQVLTGAFSRVMIAGCQGKLKACG